MTIRTDEELRNALVERAHAMGTSVSEVVRQILRDALEEKPLAERIGHLEGSLELGENDDAWRRQIRERNWRR